MTGRLCLVTSCNNCRFCLKQEDQLIMSKPTHTVATDALATLGTIIDKTAGRDAIHLAVEPVEAGEKLFPGQHISLSDGVAAASGKLVGIVDPYLPGPVFPGQMFWLVVYPRQITSLRHVWEHPAFPPASDKPTCPQGQDAPANGKAEAERWLRNYANEIDENFVTLMDAAESFIDHDEYYLGDYNEDGYRAKFEGETLPDEFWEHYQIYKGVVVPEDKRYSFFSCAC